MYQQFNPSYNFNCTHAHEGVLPEHCSIELLSDEVCRRIHPSHKATAVEKAMAYKCATQVKPHCILEPGTKK